MLITPEYREQQRKLHETTEYGTASLHYAPLVADVMNRLRVAELLDYGAGRLNLFRALTDSRMVGHEFAYTAYEPSNPAYEAIPEPTEMVACIDVLEHIEPECLDDVLDDLKRVTKRVGLFTVATTPAKKRLSDGRNAHLIVEPMSWWLPRIMQRFEVRNVQSAPGGFIVVVEPLAQ